MLGFTFIVHSNVRIKGRQALGCHVWRAATMIAAIIFALALWMLPMIAPLNVALSPRRERWMGATIY